MNDQQKNRIDMLKQDNEDQASRFWQSWEKKVEPVEPNAIQRIQNEFISDTRKHKISAAQWMPFNNRQRTRLYHPKSNRWFDSKQEAVENNYPVVECEIYTNEQWTIYRAPSVDVAYHKAQNRMRNEQWFKWKSPHKYSNPNDPMLKAVKEYDKERIYPKGAKNLELFASRSTVGMSSWYREELPFINQLRASIGLPPLTDVYLESNSYWSYGGVFKNLFNNDWSKAGLVRYSNRTPNWDFNIQAFKEAVMKADPERSMFLFQADSAKNYDGVNRTECDNLEIVDALASKKLFSSHDIAYHLFDPKFDPRMQLVALLHEVWIMHHVYHSRWKLDTEYNKRLGFSHLRFWTEQEALIWTNRYNSDIIREHFLAMPDVWRYLYEFTLDPLLHEARLHDVQVFVQIVNEWRFWLMNALWKDWQYLAWRWWMFDELKMSHQWARVLAQEHAIYAVPTLDESRFYDEGGTKWPVMEVVRWKNWWVPEEDWERIWNAITDIMKKYPSIPFVKKK